MSPPFADYFYFNDELLLGVEVVTSVSHNHAEGLNTVKATMATELEHNESGKKGIRKKVEEQLIQREL